MDYINKILCGNDLEILPKLPSESVNCCVCSPPYWGLRDYGIEPVIWDGDKNCNHEFNEYDSKLLHKNRQNLDGGTLGNPKYRENLHGFGSTKAGFCSKCGAWRGSLGLEPTFELYIKHLCDIFDEVKRVLRKDGVCFVNIGDSYGGSGNASGHKEHTRNLGYKTLEMGASQGNQKTTRGYEKSLLDIPYRFSIEMINRGWIKRNTIIWEKPNCMPSSANDRFTIDFEYLFFFTKNNKAIFWTNEKTLECLNKKPLGIKGIEGRDWEWQKKESSWQRPSRDETFKLPLRKKSNYAKEGYKKVSLWTGHDYWFEQQFEEYKGPLDRWGGNKLKAVNKSDWDKGTGQSTYRDRNMRPNKQGRNMRAVWTIPTSPYPEAHFAVYPEGEYLGKGNLEEHHAGQETKTKFKVKANSEYKSKGYSDCGCNAGFESGIVLDPFMGAGTTALVALKQRKRFIGIEIKQEYIDMAKKRIKKVQPNLF